MDKRNTITAEKRAQEIMARYEMFDFGASELTAMISEALTEAEKDEREQCAVVCLTRAAEYQDYRGNQKREAEACARAIRERK